MRCISCIRTMQLHANVQIKETLPRSARWHTYLFPNKNASYPILCHAACFNIAKSLFQFFRKSLHIHKYSPALTIHTSFTLYTITHIHFNLIKFFILFIKLCLNTLLITLFSLILRQKIPTKLYEMGKY